ncbi:MAG TPA: hypothetical protein VKV21_02560 [Solirubrobacteraceae bacterium]|nr:hypothetical protein [Solirubrobacteraceae bacterium]
MTSDGTPPTRIFLRPVGSPLTIAMSGLAIASLAQAGLDLRWFKPTQAHTLGLILISVPFVLQFLGCVFAYLSRDGAAGATIGVLAASWLGLGLVHLSSAPGSRSGELGLMLIAAGGVLMLSAIAMATFKPLPGTVFALAGIRFVLTGVYEVGAGSTWARAAGIVSLVVLGLAAYSVLAFELEGEQHRPVLPTFRRGRARVATDDDPSRAIDGVASEAGVRQMT